MSRAAGFQSCCHTRDNSHDEAYAHAIASLGRRVRAALAQSALIDGVPGVFITVGGRPVTVMAFTVVHGAITAIRVLADPHHWPRSSPRGSCDQGAR